MKGVISISHWKRKKTIEKEKLEKWKERFEKIKDPEGKIKARKERFKK